MTTPTPTVGPGELTDRFIEALLRLRAASGFAPKETVPGRGVWRWGFRSGGWPVSVDLDESVLELRVYHDRDEVAMGRVPAKAMSVLLGREPMPAGFGGATAPEAVADLRRIVADWKRLNPRIFIRPPIKVGHPDNWNDA